MEAAAAPQPRSPTRWPTIPRPRGGTVSVAVARPAGRDGQPAGDRIAGGDREGARRAAPAPDRGVLGMSGARGKAAADRDRLDAPHGRLVELHRPAPARHRRGPEGGPHPVLRASAGGSVRPVRTARQPSRVHRAVRSAARMTSGEGTSSTGLGPSATHGAQPSSTPRGIDTRWIEGRIRGQRGKMMYTISRIHYFLKKVWYGTQVVANR